MYEVQWTHTAVTDLHDKVRTPEARRYLQLVARTALDRHQPPWGGRARDLLWRRGVTPPDEATGGDGAEFVLVYERCGDRVPRAFVVLGVLTNAELVAALGAGPAAGPPRRPRLTRRPGDAARRR